MKKQLLLTLLAVVLTGSLFAQQTLLTTWTFDDLPAAPHTPLIIPSNTDIGLQTGTACIYANGSNGSSLLTSTSINPDITVFTGSTLNDPRTTTYASMALTIADSAINGSSIVLKFSTTGYQNIVLSFATRGTATGFDSHVWAYSTDGANFTTIDGNNTASRSNSFALATVDLSAFSVINDQSTVYLRLTVDGANSVNGNNRLDNIQINGTPAGDDTYSPYVTNSAVIDSTHATITFSEVLNTTAAELTTNYNFTGGYSVSSATLATDNTVTLTITPALAIDNSYSLAIHNMEDLAGNSMADTTVTLVYGVPADRQFTTLAAAREAETGATVYKYIGEAVVTFTAANRNQKYIQDGTAALVIDDHEGIITSALTTGDKITNFYFTLTNYNGLLQATPTVDCVAISSDNDVYAPIAATISELATNYDLYESELVTLSEVTFAAGTFTTTATNNINISQGDDVMECRNQFRTLDTTIAEGFTANVTGFVLRYNTTIQIAPRDHSDIE
ncbi:MAG: hypothetical protein LBV74_08545, partial [Tannerella sp.]|nr:hypothetical protein [Tannerella sp.]